MEEAMSERELEQIEKRAEAATEGEWWVTLGSGDNLCTAIHAEDESGNMTFIADFLPDWALETAERNHVPNMEFCLHARQDIPNLLSEVRRLQSEASEAAELREKLNSAGEHEALDAAADDVEYQRLEQENAELRERVEGLEGVLGDVDAWFDAAATRGAKTPTKASWLREHVKGTLYPRAEPANVQAKLENQEEKP